MATLHVGTAVVPIVTQLLADTRADGGYKVGCLRGVQALSLPSLLPFALFPPPFPPSFLLHHVLPSVFPIPYSYRGPSPESS